MMDRARLDDDVDELEALRAGARVKFAASPLPAGFMMKLGAARVRRSGWCVMRKSEDGIRAVLIALSMAEAVARQHRLNLPHRPDGFHYWN
jgi:hypothetical protein